MWCFVTACVSLGDFKMKKVLLTASVHYHFTCFHFPLIDLLHENGYEVEIAAKSCPENEPLERLTSKIEKFHDIDFARSPTSFKNIASYKALKKVIDEGDFDAIHCHTPAVSVLTRIAARKARKKGTKVIYTAHGFHFYKGAPKLYWLVFCPIEMLCGRLFTDCLIVICDEDDERMKRLKFCKTTRRTHGVGVDGSKYSIATPEENRALREKYGFARDDVLCLCTAELNANKNQQLLIRALPYLKESCPKLKILFAGSGDKAEEYSELAKSLGVADMTKFLGYRTDVDSLLKMCDFISSVSYHEGLPANIMEGMFSAKAAVVSHNRGHNELVAEGENGLFVPFDDAPATAKALETLYKDEDLRIKMGKIAYKRVQKYSSDKIKKELEEIYKEILFDRKERE